MQTLKLNWTDEGPYGSYRGKVNQNGSSIRVSIEQDDCALDPRKDYDNMGTMVCWHRRYDLGDEQRRDTVFEWLEELALSLDPTLEDRISYWYEGNGWATLLKQAEDPDKSHWEVQNDASTAANERIRALVEKVIDEQIPVMLPLYLYDHSGISMSTRSFVGRAQHADWDSGQVGWIYVTKQGIRDNFLRERVTKKLIEQAEKVLRAEVKEYDHCLRGNVWGYQIEVIHKETCEACGHVEEVEDFEDSCWGYLGDPDEYLLSEVNAILERFDLEAAL